MSAPLSRRAIARLTRARGRRKVKSLHSVSVKLSLATLQQLATLAQTVVATVAITVAGLWAFYQHKALLGEEKARQEVERFPAIDATVEVVHRQAWLLAGTDSGDQRGRQKYDYLQATVSLKNNGKTDEVIDVRGGPLSIRRINAVLGEPNVAELKTSRAVYCPLAAVRLDADLGEVLRDRRTGVRVAPGSTATLTYVLRIADVGLFHVSFDAPAYGPANSLGSSLVAPALPGGVPRARLRASAFIGVDSVTSATSKLPAAKAVKQSKIIDCDPTFDPVRAGLVAPEFEIQLGRPAPPGPFEKTFDSPNYSLPSYPLSALPTSASSSRK